MKTKMIPPLTALQEQVCHDVVKQRENERILEERIELVHRIKTSKLIFHLNEEAAKELVSCIFEMPFNDELERILMRGSMEDYHYNSWPLLQSFSSKKKQND